MNTFRSLRILVLALTASLIPASSFGGVFISVNFAPPVMPVYVQPPCPEPGLIWVPGYWAYGEDGYYWVPGTWVPAPYEGALWTPPYWGWDTGLYVFHPGYWGLHVGYYGGVNYGFGYMGVGFVGGMWHGHDFIYNTAVMHVDERYVHNVYVDRDVVRRYTVVNDRRVSFSGGRDGIHHDPFPEERFADRDRHVMETRFQQSNERAASSDRSYYARNNGGHPVNVVAQRPMGIGPNSMPDNRGGFQGRDNGNANQRPQYPADAGNRGRYDDPRSNVRNNDNRNTYNPPQGVNNQNRGFTPQQDPRSNARNNDNRNTYNPPQGVNNQNRGYTPQQDPRSNARNSDNRNTYNPPNAGSQNRDYTPRQENPRDQYRYNPQPGNQNAQNRNSAPPQNNSAPQFRNYNNSHGSQDNMQNRGGSPPQQPQQPQQPRGDQGGHGGDNGDHGHGRGH
jgi:hypothetical protein